MKLKWSMMRIPTEAAFQSFKNLRSPKFTSLVGGTYTRYRLDIPPRTSDAPEFAQNKEHWDESARALCSPRKELVFGRTVRRAAPTVERPNQVSFMYEQNGESVYGTDPPPDTPIDAIQYNLNRRARERSRLNLVVRPECTGEPLRKKLLSVCTGSREVIQQWKVMSPTLGTEGPESAVIYLGATFNDVTVIQLIDVLSTELSNDLFRLPHCPWGHIELKPGIYGFDLPDANLERGALEQGNSGSAGRIISAIICKAAWEAAENLYHGQDAQAYQQKINSEEKVKDYLRARLDLVLQEIDWELED